MICYKNIPKFNNCRDFSRLKTLSDRQNFFIVLRSVGGRSPFFCLSALQELKTIIVLRSLF